jgi:hypothetical protein
MTDTCGLDLVWSMCGDINCAISWMDRWQTMLTGITALIAATIGVYFVRKQIEQTEAAEAHRRKRRLAAARSRLQLALSTVSHYGSDSIGFLRGFRDALSANQAVPTLADAPRPVLPEPAVLALEAVIEATDNDGFAGFLADLISEMQVLNSRMSGLPADALVLGVHNLDAYLMNATKVYAFASGAFPYARRDTVEPPTEIDWSNVNSALRIHQMYDEQYEELFAFVERAAERANNPRS